MQPRVFIQIEETNFSVNPAGILTMSTKFKPDWHPATSEETQMSGGELSTICEEVKRLMMCFPVNREKTLPVSLPQQPVVASDPIMPSVN